MNNTAIFFTAVGLLAKFLPPKPPPVIDFTSLSDKMPTYDSLAFPAPSLGFASLPAGPPAIQARVAVAALPPAPATSERLVSTSCIACSRSHLSTVSGALGESLRFARDGGLAHPEVVRRLALAEDEINVMERIDLSAESIQQSPKGDQALARYFLPKIRELRQNLGGIKSVEELEKTAADASVLTQEFRLRHLESKGVDLNPVVALAKKVQAGEITMEEAKERLKTMLPEDG